MAKRAIEEEFDRLFSEFIENPKALPRLKKRVKRCRQVATGHPQASTPSPDDSVSSFYSSGNAQLDDAVIADDSSPAKQKKSSFFTLDVVNQNDDNQVADSLSHKQGIDVTLPDHNNPIGLKNDHPALCSEVLPSKQHNETSDAEVINDVTDSDSTVIEDGGDTMVTVQTGEDGNHNASDIFMLHKPRLSRVHVYSMQKSINLDALWAVYAKSWLRPKYAVESQARPPVFLKRNQQQGRVCFKRYLSWQKACNNLTKSQLSSCQPEPQSAKQRPARAGIKQDFGKNTEAATARSKDETKLNLANSERDRVRKRKDSKPKLHVNVNQKPARAKTDADKDALKSSRDAVTRATHLRSEKIATKLTTGLQKDSAKGKQVQTRKHKWKRHEASKTAGPSKQVWTKETTVGKQVAVCRPTAKGKTCTLDRAAASKIYPVLDEDPKRQLGIPESVQERASAVTDSRKFVAVETEDMGVGSRIKPLFASKSGHCGGIWKSIVDEC